MWWDEAAFASVRRTADGKEQLHCPYCGGQCELHSDRESFLHMARRFELIGFTGHRALMEWSQGKCFRTRADAWHAMFNEPLRRVSGRPLSRTDLRVAPHGKDT
jgi:hypothetical protein